MYKTSTLGGSYNITQKLPITPLRTSMPMCVGQMLYFTNYTTIKYQSANRCNSLESNHSCTTNKISTINLLAK